MLLLILTLACGDKDGDDTSGDGGAQTDGGGTADGGATGGGGDGGGAGDGGGTSDGGAGDGGTGDGGTGDGGASELGFEFDGAWYPLTPGAIFCQEVSDLYTFSSGALRDGTGPQGNGYAYFADVPTPGEYVVGEFVYGGVPPAGEAWLGVVDYRDTSFWFSDGDSGTLTVQDAGGGALDVRWTSSTLVGASGVRTTAEGWLTCTPT